MGAPYGGSVTSSGGAPITWTSSRLPSGLALNSSTGVLTGKPTAAGKYTITVEAIDGDGITASATYPITIASRVTRPAISKASESHRRWYEKKRSRRPYRTTFRFALNEPARVTLAFTHKNAGRTVKHRCVAPTHKNRKTKRCTLTVGSLRINGKAGNNSTAFSGHPSGSHKLAPRRYVVVITATGGETSTPADLTFTIL